MTPIYWIVPCLFRSSFIQTDTQAHSFYEHQQIPAHSRQGDEFYDLVPACIARTEPPIPLEHAYSIMYTLTAQTLSSVSVFIPFVPEKDVGTSTTRTLIRSLEARVEAQE